VEIIEQVFVEIKTYGHEDPRKKLIAGIVLTGGGAQLKHIKQLVEYITGMDTRIGFPNEHLAGNSDEEIASPLYATAVGLVMNSIENNSQSAVRITFSAPEPVVVPRVPIVEVQDKVVDDEVRAVPQEVVPETPKPTESTMTKIKESFFDRYVAKIKDFLDKAE
jgi:cell division protein FtsA